MLEANAPEYARRPARRRAPRVRLLSLMAVAMLVVAACGKDSNSGSSTTPTTPGTPICRTYASTITEVFTSPLLTATSTANCSYSTSTNQLTCRNSYTDNVGCTTTITAVTSYTSTADFVDEVSVVPPLTRATGVTSTLSNAACHPEVFAPPGIVTYTYDSQNRLTQAVLNFSNQTTSYTGWDGSGRPTAGFVAAPAYNSPLTLTYDNAARKQTYSVTGLQITTTFDGNGNRTEQSVNTAGVISTITSTNVSAPSARVCR